MNKFASLLLLVIAAAMSVPAAYADNTAPSAVKKTKKKTAKKIAEPKVEAVVDEDEKEPDTTGSAVSEYNCELGNKLTVYRNADDDRHIGMRWKNRIHRLTRIDTTTGAGRFENRPAGLIWITIPAKGMLLDGKRGQQLANECKVAEVPKAVEPAAADTPKG